MTINASFSCFSTIFGFVVTTISLLALIFSTWYSHLPSSKIKELESLLEETECCFRKAIEEGLLTELTFVRRIEDSLARLKLQTHGLRLRAYAATTLYEDYIEFFRGTSLAIRKTCRAVKEIRADVIKYTEQERQRLAEGQLVRPQRGSTEPAAQRVGNLLCVSVEIEPSRDTGQGNTDVRTIDTLESIPIIHTSVTLEDVA